MASPPNGSRNYADRIRAARPRKRRRCRQGLRSPGARAALLSIVTPQFNGICVYRGPDLVAADGRARRESCGPEDRAEERREEPRT